MRRTVADPAERYKTEQRSILEGEEMNVGWEVLTRKEIL
jgi:hypothetical protein